jgi:hypothetical protein
VQDARFAGEGPTVREAGGFQYLYQRSGLEDTPGTEAVLADRRRRLFEAGGIIRCVGNTAQAFCLLPQRFRIAGQACERTGKQECQQSCRQEYASVLAHNIIVYRAGHVRTRANSFARLRRRIGVTLHRRAVASGGSDATAVAALAAVLDYLALVGMWIALALTVRWALKRRFGPLESCIYAFAFGAVWLGNQPIWAGAYEFGRTMSPLFILLGLLAIRENRRASAVPYLGGMRLPRYHLMRLA